VLNILLVDDEGIIVDVLKQILIRLGHNVETAPGGQEGMLKFDEQSYDLVITDVVMSEPDGHQVARHIRDSKKAATPIIGISGTPFFLDDHRFNSVIPKPFTVTALAQAIDRAMGSTATSPSL
jgi:two-component system capsular synthesis sensor histidine kinase RcsC